jgi:hypothetical protein
VHRLVALLPNPQSRHGHARDARNRTGFKSWPQLGFQRRVWLKTNFGGVHSSMVELIMSRIMPLFLKVIRCDKVFCVTIRIQE